ncbi:hypothetical protein, partial [Plasmodium yoelii yoelii]
NIIKIY